LATSTPITRRDLRFLAACVAISIVSGYVGVRYYDRVFPEAAITFSVGRDAAETGAISFLRSRGFSLEGYRHAAAFQYDDEAKTFLERELGAERAGALADGPLRLWRWAHRWFVPLQKEEFAVSFTTRGELTGFIHQIPEDAPGERLSEETARARAQGLLSQIWPAKRPLEFVLHSQQERPNRIDHTFVWKDPAYSGSNLLGRDEDAQYRVEVTVQGGRADGLHEYLKPPETWQRDYDQLRSRNQTASLVDTGLNLFLIIGLLVVLVQRLRAHDVQWTFAMKLAAVGATLVVLAGLNGLPLKLFSFDTSSSYASFVGQHLLSLLLGAVGAFAGYSVLAGGAEPLMRGRAPEQLALPRLFSLPALRSRAFLIQLVLGFTLTFFFFAYENGFYLAAQKLGAWSPRDVPYDELLNSKMPWAFVASFGFMPAVTEEFIWRLFAIPFLLKLTRSPVIAIVVPAFLWGFGHAAYPQQPFWIRGVEVGIVGIVAGLVFVRFGVVATLVWHYTTDAFYSALVLLRSHDPGHVVSGAVGSGILFVPLLAALVLYLRHRGFGPDEGILNRDFPPPREPVPSDAPAPAIAEADAKPPWAAVSSRRMIIAAAVGLALVALKLVPVEKWGDFVEFRVTPDEARQKARSYLEKLGIPGEEFRGDRVALGVTNAFEHPPRPIQLGSGSPYVPPPFDEPHAARYLARNGGVAAANAQYRDRVRAVTYLARFFREGEPTEEWVEVDARSGELAAFERHVPEDAPGQSLSETEAKAAVERGLEDAGYHASDFTLKDQKSEKRKSRTDWRFVFEEAKGAAPGAEASRLRVGIELQGAVLGKIERWEYAPEDWVRKDEEQTVFDTVRSGVRIAVLLGLGVAGFLLLLFGIRRGQVRWKTVLVCSAIPTLAMLIAQLLDLPARMLSYPTSTELSLFRGMQAVMVALPAFGTFVACAACLALASALYPQFFDAWRSSSRGATLRKSSLVAGAGLIFLAGIRVAGNTVAAMASRNILVSGVVYPPEMASLAPGIASLERVLQGAVGLAVAVTVAYLAQRYLKKTALQIVVLVALAAILVPGEARTGGTFLAAFSAQLVAFGGAYLLVRFVVGTDQFAYVLLAIVAPLAFAAVGLLSEPSMYFRLQGAIPLVAALGVLAWAVLASSRRPVLVKS
jgi:membrane protease YdiL (CAAX protease family)